MKAYSFITGRGPISGYSFIAATPNIPYTAPWMSGQRASDTIGQVPIVEMHCAGFMKPVFISSRWVVDSRPFGYTEYLVVPVPLEGEQRKAFLEQPGAMLYYPFYGKEAFMALDVPGCGGQARLPVEEIEMPPLQSGKQTRIPEEILACLLVDVWANSFIRMSGRKYDPIRLNLSSLEQKEQAQEEGIRFLNEIILPCLPEVVRHTVSVNIGAFWSSLPKGENGGAPALAITLPEEQGFQMSGGYDLVNQQYTMRYPQDFSEVGRALLRNQNLEYYRTWCDNKPNHRLLANFFAVLSLVHIRVALRKGDLSSLLFAYRHYQQLESLLSADYQEIDSIERRELCLQIEDDLILALAEVVNEDTVYPDRMVDHLVQHAFSLREDLSRKEDENLLCRIEGAYTILLSQPGAPKDGGKEPPAYSLFTNRGLRDMALLKNPSLFYDILEKGLQHAQLTPLADSSFSAMEELYRKKASDKPRLARIISDYVITGLGNGFDISRATKVQDLLSEQTSVIEGLALAVVQRFTADLPEAVTDDAKLREANNFLNVLDISAVGSHILPKSEAVNLQMLQAVSNYIQNHPDNYVINLKELFSAATKMQPGAGKADKTWLSYSHMTEAVCALIHYRGQTEGAKLFPDEADLLISLMQAQKEQAPAMIKEALKPLVAQPLTEQTLQSLEKILPFVYSTLPMETPENGWLIAWKKMLLSKLKVCLKSGAGSIRSLLHPQAIWHQICPIRNPGLDNLDQLSKWHMAEADLINTSDVLLSDVLSSLSQNDLSANLSEWQAGTGWFSHLLERKMKDIFVDDKYHQFLNHPNTIEDILSMERLLQRYNDNEKYRHELEALRFITKGLSRDLGLVLRKYFELSKRSIAGSLLDKLLEQAPSDVWNHHIEDIRMAMALMAVTQQRQPTEEAMPAFLSRLGIEIEKVHKLNPWDKKEGTQMLSIFLNIFRWFNDTGMDNLADALAGYLQPSKFTKKVRGKQKKQVFSPMIGDKKTQKAPCPTGLSKWLNLKQDNGQA